MERGRFLSRIIRYIKENDFDIVALQEVSGNSFSYKRQNCFGDLIRETGYTGQLSTYVNTRGDISSYLANATLFKKSWKLHANHVIWMKRYTEVVKPEMVTNPILSNFRKTPRCALATLLEKNNFQVMVINTHLAWGPTPDDAVYKKNQATKLLKWIKAHSLNPYIITGDFNLNPRTLIVSRFSRLGNNLTLKYKAGNTLNPRTHKVKHLFPTGIPVDYIISDKQIKVGTFYLEDKVDLSDHLGLVAEFSVK